MGGQFQAKHPKGRSSKVLPRAKPREAALAFLWPFEGSGKGKKAEAQFDITLYSDLMNNIVGGLVHMTNLVKKKFKAGRFGHAVRSEPNFQSVAKWANEPPINVARLPNTKHHKHAALTFRGIVYLVEKGSEGSVKVELMTEFEKVVLEAVRC